MVLGRSFRPSRLIPAATAPELTRISSLPLSCSSDTCRASSSILSSSMPSLDDRIWLPTLITTRRARLKMAFLCLSCGGDIGTWRLLSLFELRSDVLHKAADALRGCSGNFVKRLTGLRQLFRDQSGLRLRLRKIDLVRNHDLRLCSKLRIIKLELAIDDFP